MTGATPLIDFQPETQPPVPSRQGAPQPKTPRPIQNAPALGSATGFGFQEEQPKPPTAEQPKENVGVGLLKGVGEGLLQDTASVGRLINKIPLIGEKLVPSQGLNAERQLATPTTTAQKIGAGAEQTGEMFLPTGEAGTLAKIGMGALKGGVSTAMHEGGTTEGVQPRDVAVNTLIGGAAPAAESGIKGMIGSKVGRGMINESVGANARDVTYGNPAKALLDEGIANVKTGDVEKVKDAFRSGATPAAASQAAGGRMAAVSGKINELSPQLDSVLSQSTAQIPVAQVIDQPLNDAANQIIGNAAMTSAEKDAALKQLGDLQTEMKQGLGQTITPQQANAIKRQVGDRVNWGGTTAVGDEVKPAYRSLYGSLKKAIDQAVPESSQINERLTNLLAASKDLERLARQEEVGAGRGAIGGSVGRNLLGRAESSVGRVLPATSKYGSKVPVAGGRALIGANSQNLIGGGQQ